MTTLTIFATLEVQPGTRDAVVRALLEHRVRCLRDEPGTLRFDVLVPDDKPMLPGAPAPASNPNAIMLYEVYQDHAAFATHWSSPSLAQARKDAGMHFIRLSGVPFRFAADE